MGGRKTFVTNTVLTAADVQDYLMDQSVMVFSDSTTRGSAIPTPTEGMVTYLSGSDSLEAYNGANWLSTAGVSSGNYIINGGFDVWQRGTNFTSGFNSSIVYTADRWYFYNNGNGSQAVSRDTFFEPFMPDVPGNFGPHYLANAINSIGTSTDWIMEQRIEDLRNFLGKTVTLSFYARSGNTQTIGAKFFQYFGIGGSAMVSGTFVDSISLTSNWTRYTYTVTLPSTDGKVFGTDSSLIIGFNSGSAIKTGVVYFAGVQLEISPAATQFRRNANSLEGELAACQRYYYRAAGGGSSALPALGITFFQSTTSGVAQVEFPVSMRRDPVSIDFSSLEVNRTGVSTHAVTVCTLNAGLSSPKIGSVSITFATSGAVQGQVGLFEGSTSTGFIGFSAEL
jgi:hypothetical protein